MNKRMKQTLQDNLEALFSQQDVVATNDLADALLINITSNVGRSIRNRLRSYGLTDVVYIGYNQWALLKD